jgi:outer membrane protein TolC
VQRSALARELSQEDFRRILMDTLALVDRSYWDLAAQRANEGVARKSLETASELLEQTQVQYEVGVVSKVNVSQALAGQAQREFGLITAENLARNAQDVLIDLIAQPTLDDYLATTIETENPGWVEYDVDQRAAVERAMDYRPEVIQARQLVEDALLALALAKNQVLPRLDVIGGYTFNGIAGSSKTVNDVIEFDDIKVPEEGYRANSQFFSKGGQRGWEARAQFEIPIGNRTARHREIQAQIELRRSRRRLRLQEQNVTLEVRQASRNLSSSIDGIEAAERARVAQEDSLRAEQERLRLGDSTPFQVLQFEEDLAQASREEIFALRTYRDSVTALERSQGTLLRARGVDVEAVAGCTRAGPKV